MNTLDSLFDWMLNAGLRASVLVLVVLAVRALTGKRLPARWRYALWLPVLAALVLPGIPLLPSSLFPSPVATAPPVAKAPETSLSEPMGKPETASATIPTSVAPVPTENEVPVAAVPPVPTTTSVAPEIPKNTAAAAAEAVPASLPWREIFTLAWLVGVVLAVVFVGGSYLLTLRRIRRRSVPAAPELLEHIARLSQSLGLRRAPQVCLSEAVASPAVCGWLRPMLLLNATFPADLTADEADMVLRHELTHIRRGDLLLNPFLCGLLALHWFNPLLWIAFSRVRADREAACDADVLRDETDANRAAYGQTLLKMETAFPPSGMCLGFVGILQRGSILRDRIQSIIARPKLSKLMKAGLALGIIGLAVLGLAKAATSEKIVTLEEFKKYHALAKMPETMRHVQLSRIKDGFAVLDVSSKIPFTNEWNHRRIKVEFDKLDLELQEEFMRGTRWPGFWGMGLMPDEKAYQGRGEWGPEVSGLSCRITPEKTTYSEPGEAVRVMVEIRNNSGKPVTVAFDPRLGTNKVHEKGTPRENEKDGTLKLAFSNGDSGNIQSNLLWFPSPLDSGPCAAVRKPSGEIYPPLTSTLEQTDPYGTFVIQPNDTYAEFQRMAVSSVENRNTGKIKPDKGTLSAEVAVVLPETGGNVKLKSNAVGISFNTALFPGRGKWSGWKTGAYDVECRITPEKSEYDMGEPLRLLVEIRNNGMPITLKQDGKLLLEFSRADGGSYGGKNLPFPADPGEKRTGFDIENKTTFSKIVTYDWGRAEWESAPAHGPFRMLIGDYRVGAQFIGLSNPGNSKENLLFNSVPLKVIPLPAAREAALRVEKFHRSLVKEQEAMGIKAYSNERPKAYQDKVRAFFAGLQDRDSRLAAVQMLGALYIPVVNRELATELLGPLIRDEDPEVKAEAASAIAHHQCGALYAKELIAMLDGNLPKATLLNVIGSMRTSGHQPFAGHLGKLLGHPDDRVRELTIKALVALSPETAPALIKPLLNDQNGDVKRAAEEGLRQIADRAKDHAAGAQHGEVELFCQNLNPDGSGKNSVSYKGTQFPMTAKFGQKGELDLMWQFVEHRDGADVYQVSVAYTTDPSVKTPAIKWAEPANAPGRGKPALRKVAFTGKPNLVFEDGERRITLRASSINDWHVGNFSGNSSVLPGDLYPALFKGRSEWGPEVAGLSCRITTDKTEYEIDESADTSLKRGEPVRVLVEVRNDSDKPITLGRQPTPESEPALHVIFAQSPNPLPVEGGFLSGGEGNYSFLLPKLAPGEFASAEARPFPDPVTPNYEMRGGFDGKEFAIMKHPVPGVVVLQPKATHTVLCSFVPWGPIHYRGDPIAAKPGKMHLSAAIWQFLNPDGSKTVLPFKPVEITVKAKDEGKEAGAKPSATSASNPTEKRIVDLVYVVPNGYRGPVYVAQAREVLPEVAERQKNTLMVTTVDEKGEGVTVGGMELVSGWEYRESIKQRDGVRIKSADDRPADDEVAWRQIGGFGPWKRSFRPEGFGAYYIGTKAEADKFRVELERLLNLYTDEEAEAFRAKLGTLKYPTTPEAACKELGIDLKRLTGKDGLMKSEINGRVGQSWTQLSENYWLSLQFQLYLQGPDGKVVQNDKGEYDKVSIYTRVNMREVQKMEDKVEISIHDNTLVVDAISPSGIGETRLTLTSGAWPKKLVVRLKYTEDKPFTNLEGSGAALEVPENKEGTSQELNVQRFPEKNGFEAAIPATERKTLYVNWVDALRR